MDFDDYQQKALGTDQRPTGADAVIIPLLGLAGEAGTLLTEYKKYLRDGSSHAEYDSLVAEELGDALWYLANIASKFGLSLSEIAEANLAKVNDRWNVESWSYPPFFDEQCPQHEQLPRRIEIVFHEVLQGGRCRVTARCGDKVFGEPLTDAAPIDDGYRYHDALHLAFATFLGWSPLTRRNLGCKRRSDRHVDEAQDGGRALVVEEAVAAHAYSYSRRHKLLDGVGAVDFATLRTIRDLTRPFEVAVRTPVEWQTAIVEGFRLLRLLLEHRGGIVRCDLVHRQVEFAPHP
jgi:NTP pyrophosphatase (non-canonical NTP hydrolase)